MAVTCYFGGRFGNIVYSIANLLAYCKKHDLKYYIPTYANAYNKFNGNSNMPFTIPSTGEEPINPTTYREPNDKTGTPYYHEITKIDNVVFTGYYQSFNFFDWCRDYILDTFNFPYEMEKDMVSVSVRRGDCIGSPNFPIAPTEYYHNAIRYMQEKGYNNFRIYSDDIEWCKNEFISSVYNGAEFQFSEGKSELEDYISITCCEHNITARSTFSLTAAWFNRNADKIVLVPTTKHKWWSRQNKDLVPDYFTQIDFDRSATTNPYVYIYDGFEFTLFIPSYWYKIYKGVEKEPLYGSYVVLLGQLKRVSKDRYVLDIGVNHGIFAVPASKLGYKVIGFEPVKENYDSIHEAKIGNGLIDFEVYNMALSNENGVTDIYIPECTDNASFSQVAAISNMKGKEYTVEQVRTIVFDDWINKNQQFSNIGFIKIDVQGAEYKVLEGMKNFLTTISDVYLIVEFEHHLNTMGYSYEQLNELITSYGFMYLGNVTNNDRLFFKK